MSKKVSNSRGLNNTASEKAGLPPGALIHIGRRKSDKVKVTLIDYNKDHFIEKEIVDITECFPFKSKDSMSWINVDGLHDIETISRLCEHFGISSLQIEDILNTGHRPKAEEIEGQIFVTLKMLGISKDRKSIISEQVSFSMGEGWVISFQEQEGDIFDPLRKRLADGLGLLKQYGTDFLMYRMIDTVVDNYFFITEHFADVTERLEEEVMASTDNDHLLNIQKYRRQLLNLRRSTSPLREVVSILQSDASKLVKPKTRPYLRDVYDHVIQVNESMDAQREMIANIRDLHMTNISNRMNQVMQLLTIISTIFIPLSFIAGIYGMNFENIPELKWENGYFYMWGLMIFITVIMVVFFKRKKWM